MAEAIPDNNPQPSSLVVNPPEAEGEPLLRRALAIKEAAHGDSHVEVAATLHSLARLVREERRSRNKRLSSSMGYIGYSGKRPKGRCNVGTVLHGGHNA